MRLGLLNACLIGGVALIATGYIPATTERPLTKPFSAVRTEVASHVVTRSSDVAILHGPAVVAPKAPPRSTSTLSQAAVARQEEAKQRGHGADVTHVASLGIQTHDREAQMDAAAIWKRIVELIHENL